MADLRFKRRIPMIGVIVTGHGSFATGLESNVKMLAGAEASLISVPFPDGMPPEELSEKLSDALARYQDCPYTLVLADLAGGTPFNRASELSVGRENVRVISGVNSSMLMDLCMRNITEDEITDIDALAEEIMQTARDNIGMFRLEPAAQDIPEDDGI